MMFLTMGSTVKPGMVAVLLSKNIMATKLEFFIVRLIPKWWLTTLSLPFGKKTEGNNPKYLAQLVSSRLYSPSTPFFIMETYSLFLDLLIRYFHIYRASIFAKQGVQSAPPNHCFIQNKQRP